MSKSKYSKLYSAGSVMIAGLLILLPASPAMAAAVSSVATPLATTYGNPPGNSYFEEVLAPTGDWVTISTTSIEGQRASYAVPSTGVCDAATVSSLSVSVANTSAVYSSPITEDLLGVAAHVVDKSTQTTHTVSSISAGTRMDGTITSSPTYAYLVNYIARGITSPAFTSTPLSLPGSLAFNVDTAGMTVGQYNDLVVTITHDLLDGTNGFGDSVTTSQPTVSVTYDDAPCHPVATLPDTGMDARSLLINSMSLFTAAAIALYMTARQRRCLTR